MEPELRRSVNLLNGTIGLNALHQAAAPDAAPPVEEGLEVNAPATPQQGEIETNRSGGKERKENTCAKIFQIIVPLVINLISFIPGGGQVASILGKFVPSLMGLMPGGRANGGASGANPPPGLSEQRLAEIKQQSADKALRNRELVFRDLTPEQLALLQARPMPELPSSWPRQNVLLSPTPPGSVERT